MTPNRSFSLFLTYLGQFWASSELTKVVKMKAHPQRRFPGLKTAFLEKLTPYGYGYVYDLTTQNGPNRSFFQFLRSVDPVWPS